MSKDGYGTAGKTIYDRMEFPLQATYNVYAIIDASQLPSMKNPGDKVAVFNQYLGLDKDYVKNPAVAEKSLGQWHYHSNRLLVLRKYGTWPNRSYSNGVFPRCIGPAAGG